MQHEHLYSPAQKSVLAELVEHAFLVDRSRTDTQHACAIVVSTAQLVGL